MNTPSSYERLLPLLSVALLAVSTAYGCTDGLLGAPDRSASTGTTAEVVPYSHGASSEVRYTETRESCADRNPLRNAYFGDLHAHTAISLDAYGVAVRSTPDDAYRFAQGEMIALPPLENGQGTRLVQLERPLDFAAVTDHAEWLGEVRLCTVPDSPTYDSLPCQLLREVGIVGMGLLIAEGSRELPRRNPAICNPSDELCLTWAAGTWKQIQQAAETAYDRSAECTFTTFIGYEWSREPAGVAVHRNVIFRNRVVPSLPTSYFEALTVEDLWAQLKADCIDEEGCDVVTIPHFPPGSKGQMFPHLQASPNPPDIEEQRRQAAFRERIEPLVELMQTRGQSECTPGLSVDEECDFEQLQAVKDSCKEDGGCHPTSFVRGALLAGLQKESRLGVNPYRLGFIASTDTHNGTPGNAEEATYPGHLGSVDAPERIRVSAISNANQVNPGGLTGVWAVENSRDAIFEAILRRETFATSGPRIQVRFFGGFGLPSDLCDDPRRLEKAYGGGVPMGGTLEKAPAPDSRPRFYLEARRDRVDLQVAQVVKGWLDENNRWQERVYDVVGDREDGTLVDTTSCATQSQGPKLLCAVWTDPDFDPSRPAFYYARVLQKPTCRWSTYICNAIIWWKPKECDEMPKTIKERAWSSPIWYQP